MGGVLGNMASFLSSLYLVLQLGYASDFGFVLLLVPFLKYAMPSSHSYWSRGKVYWVSNPLVRYVLSIQKMIQMREFRQEVITNNMQDYLVHTIGESVDKLDPSIRTKDWEPPGLIAKMSEDSIVRLIVHMILNQNALVCSPIITWVS